jgi:hypothetical protein
MFPTTPEISSYADNVGQASFAWEEAAKLSARICSRSVSLGGYAVRNASAWRHFRDYHRREAEPALQVPECFAALESRAQPEQVPPALAAAAMPETEQLFLP